jgi:hypothetical protein
MSLSVIFSNTYTANANILNDSGVFTTSFTGNGMYVREATMHIERNGTPTNVAYIMQILDVNDNVLATSLPYSIQDLLDEFGSAQRGEPHFIFDGTFQVISGTAYKLALRRYSSSGSGSNIYVHFGAPSSYFCVIWGSVSPASQLTVTYSGNGATSGSAPTDPNSPYSSGATVTVLGNTGGLVKSGYVFANWSTNPLATSADHVAGSTFTILANTLLYAVWVPVGASFDGGTINNSLEIKCKFPPLLETWTDVANWMTTPTGNLPDYSAYLRFTNINTPLGLSTDIYGIAFKDENNNNVSGIGINDSLLVRKNLYAQSGGIGTLSVPTKLKVDTIESFTGQPINFGNAQITDTITVKAITDPNQADKWLDLKAIHFSMNPPPTQFDGFTLLQINKGGLQFLDTGGILTVTPVQHPTFTAFPTTLGTKPEYTPDPDPQSGLVNLFCSRIRPTDRTTKLDDPMLVADKGVVVEKDFQTFGFVGTTSDPQKGTGGGAILMGQGFMGKYCPPEIGLSGLMIAPDDATAKIMYPSGTSFPVPTQNKCFYRTDYGEVFQYFNGSWQSIGTVGIIGKYPTAYLNQNAPWWYDSTNKRLCKGPIDYINHTEIKFNHVHSEDLDTLFLLRGEGIEQKYAANLYLGSLTATEAIYVDNIKHRDGTNWSFGGGGGGVQKGSITTNSSGVGTFAFPAGTFPSGYTPTVVCTAHDTSGRSITAVVTSSNNTGFTVKTFLVDSHKHKVGQVYNTTNQPIVIAKGGKHHHYAVGTTGTTSHRHGIPNQGDHSHGITNTNIGGYNTSSVVAGGTNHSHTYTSWTAATNTNNGGSHNHSGNTDYETTHAHTYATTTSGSGNTAQDADAEHTHTFSQIPAYMRETVMYDQAGGQVHTGAAFTTIADNTQVTEIYTVTTVNTPIAILVNWMAM